MKITSNRALVAAANISKELKYLLNAVEDELVNNGWEYVVKENEILCKYRIDQGEDLIAHITCDAQGWYAVELQFPTSINSNDYGYFDSLEYIVQTWGKACKVFTHVLEYND